MGDDLSQPERNAVRTPMQWTSEPNAGFSTAPAAKLVRPVISKGPFGYKKLNVAAQQRDPGSLLNTFEMMLRVRRECPELGRGQMSILATNQPEVLAVRHKLQDRSLIAVHNLSAKACKAVIDIGEGIDHLTDLLDGYNHVPVEGPSHPIELAGFGYRWLRVNGER